MPGPWRLRSTGPGVGDENYVSISTEMPGPWRRTYQCTSHCKSWSFNLNRDARPLATEEFILIMFPTMKCFNLNRDARPLATGPTTFIRRSNVSFQSQPRCQAPGDLQCLVCVL